jgi:hypothetical protein
MASEPEASFEAAQDQLIDKRLWHSRHDVRIAAVAGRPVLFRFNTSAIEQRGTAPRPGGQEELTKTERWRWRHVRRQVRRRAENGVHAPSGAVA